MSRQKPAQLYHGQTIGVAAPASGVWHESDWARAQAAMTRWGFTLKPASNLHFRQGYLAGTDAERAAGFNELLRDPDVDAIICWRGGSGSLRLLPWLDYEAMRARPRILMGFSDITALHLAFGQRSGMVTFHGPNLLSLIPPNGNGYTQEQCWRALMRPEPLGEIAPDPADPFVWAIAEGEAVGELTGGCLTLVTATLGTPYEIETAGKILLLEDVGCAPYQIDAMLTQLRLAGKLQAAAGIVVGKAVEVEPDTRRGYHPSHSLDDVLLEHLADLGKPVLYGLPIGHGFHNATVPLGVRARLSGSERKLIIEEAATSL